MKPLVIIPCGAKKRTGKHKAKDLYIGSYFQGCYKYAMSITSPDMIYILSAKYGLLPLDKVVESYDLTLGQRGCVTARQVREQANALGILNTTPTVVSGQRYANICKAAWGRCITPLEGIGGMGKQLQWMKNNRQSGVKVKA